MTVAKIFALKLMRPIKRVTRAFAIIMVVILISGVFTYFKPIGVESIGYQYYNDKTYRIEKTNQITNLMYGENLIRQKVNEIKSQTSNPQHQIDLALAWITQNVRPQDASPSPVIDDNYYNVLKRGSGSCDQAAYVFSVLSTRLGIPARMIMLRDRNGISHHTASEVYLDDKWQYIDPWLGIFPHKADGTGYTRFELAKNQFALVKYGYAPRLTEYEFANSVVFETFPFMSFDKLLRKFLSKLGNLYKANNSSPGGLNNLAQTNNGLSGDELTTSELDSLRLFDKARSNHLDENFDKARTGYQESNMYGQIAFIAEAARFFFGVTYFDQHRYEDAEKYFKHAILTYENNPWKNSHYRFLAESLIAQGKIDEAKIWLNKSTSQGAHARLRYLEEGYPAGLVAPFISY
jgi:tetratricopeptide (TPR) repeat protein